MDFGCTIFWAGKYHSNVSQGVKVLICFHFWHTPSVMELYFRKFGAGPPLIIVHGLYGSSDNWIRIGRSLGRHFEVVIPDQRNHGRSPHSEQHNYELLRADLLEFMDRQSIERAVLLGHSMGGKTVMFFAASYPDRINGLVVVDIAPRSYSFQPGIQVPTTDHMHMIRALEKLDLSRIKKREEADRELSVHIESPRVRQFLLKNLQRDANGQFMWKLNLEAIRNDLPRILEGLNESEFEQGRQITGFPILFIKGEKSNYILDSDIQLIHKIFPFAEVVSIPDAGHWLHVEKGEVLIQEIVNFILAY